MKILAGWVCGLVLALGLSAAAQVREPVLAREALAEKAFGADASWYLRNIPFVEIDDPEIQEIYYYRWKVFRSHLREIGWRGAAASDGPGRRETTVTEFLGNVPWARQPYTDLNDSASFHLLEARWLRDPGVGERLIDHLYTGGGNDRHFSESIAAATEAFTRVTGDPGPGLRHLDAMQHVFNLWDDHFDRARGLYWVEPIADATEYTIASIDASGAGFEETASTDQNRNGFTGGYAFRPSINSYQYANARAIARFAGQDASVRDEYTGRAEALRAAMLRQLWNPELRHFTDRYQRSTEFVKAGEFVRGRELVGFVPWMFEAVPRGAAEYGAAWTHVLGPGELDGSAGLRTVEPSYPRYMAQYRYDAATRLRECQWNGPSWPFQTSQTLTGMANLLDDYPDAARGGVTAADYLRLLRQYTRQHYLAPGHPDLQEDYDPDTGKPIVGLPRSHHYLHSTYVDLVLSGLLGVRPRTDEVLEIAPLVPAEVAVGERAIRYFAVEGLRYHGHEVGVVYDRDGTRYGIGRGMSVFVDGVRVAGPEALGRREIALTPKKFTEGRLEGPDWAANVGTPDGPRATASSSASEEGIMEANDGRMWFFPEEANGWSPADAEKGKPNWWAVDFGRERRIGRMELFFFADGEELRAPASFVLQRKTAEGWVEMAEQSREPKRPLANGENIVMVGDVLTRELRVLVTPGTGGGTFRLVELKAFSR